MFRRTYGIAALLCALGAVGIGAGSASAATTNPFGCTASTATATVGGTNLLPGATSANPNNTPCATDSSLLAATNINPAGLGLVNIGVGPVSATTTLSTTQANGSTVYTGANATSTVDALNLGVLSGLLPPPLGGLNIAVTTPSTATVNYACVNNALVPTFSSTLNVITINGQTIPLTGLPQTLALPGPLAGLVTLAVNQHTSTATSDTETLLSVQILNSGLLSALGGGVDLNVGTATASTTQASPCAGTAVPPCAESCNGGGGGNGGGNGGNGGNGGGGNGGGGNGGGGANGGNGGSGSNSGNCPVGSTVASGGLCEIAAGSEGNSSAITFNSGDISGGTVYSLAYAKKHYKSLCLNGAGPNYAVIGNNSNNTITVSGTRQRVLGLGGKDKLTVKSGNNTCVDAGSGNDTVKAAKSPVKVYGGAGNDKITAGNGNDVVYGDGGQDVIKAGNGKDSLNGGGGNDTITAGNGADHLYGNAGADKLTAGTGHDFLFGAAGNDILRARGNVAFVNGGKGHNVAYVKNHAMASFARKHGTKVVHII
jgi:Ca2+-binding RTX toxin-like protein